MICPFCRVYSHHAVAGPGIGAGVCLHGTNRGMVGCTLGKGSHTMLCFCSSRSSGASWDSRSSLEVEIIANLP